MKMNKYILGLMLGGALVTTSCSDFLDTAPDTRTEINDVESVRKLLVDAYTGGNYAVIAELSSDNVVDNNAPHDVDGKMVYYNLPQMDKSHDELFAFDPVTLTSYDSPANIWSYNYAAIATVNHALENLDRIEAEGNLSAADKAKAKAVRAEGLLSRAYHHFILVNLFSQAYRTDELSKDAPGIPYVTKPETDLVVHYDRGNVTDVYKKIEEDLTKGLEMVNDAYYKVPKYHFNKAAAYAFAVRFYLYKRDYDKVIKYANLILGEEPGNVVGGLRDYTKFDGLTQLDDYVNVWTDVDSPSNIMLMATYSVELRVFASGYRYAINHEAARGTINGFGPSWSLSIIPVALSSGLFTNGGQDYGLYWAKFGEKFQYSDKTSGVGYPRVIRLEFTKEEVLLSRAEAYIMKNELQKGFADLKAWDESVKKLAQDQSQYFTELTEKSILDFYKEAGGSKSEYGKYNTLDFSHTSDWAPGFVVSEEQAPYLNCCLHFRRIETLASGLRFFDLKRYAIEWTHKIGKKSNMMEAERTETMVWNDRRRAIEVPQDALSMGLETSRKYVPESANKYVKLSSDSDLIFESKN